MPLDYLHRCLQTSLNCKTRRVRALQASQSQIEESLWSVIAGDYGVQSVLRMGKDATTPHFYMMEYTWREKPLTTPEKYIQKY